MHSISFLGLLSCTAIGSIAKLASQAMSQDLFRVKAEELTTALQTKYGQTFEVIVLASPYNSSQYSVSGQCKTTSTPTVYFNAAKYKKGT